MKLPRLCNLSPRLSFLDMTGERNLYRLTERPSWLSGYLPDVWFVVCGGRGETGRDPRSIDERGPNPSQVGCLEGEPEFPFGSTGMLWKRVSIKVSAIIVQDMTHTSSLDPSLAFDDPTKRKALGDLSNNGGGNGSEL